VESVFEQCLTVFYSNYGSVHAVKHPKLEKQRILHISVHHLNKFHTVHCINLLNNLKLNLLTHI